MTISLVIPAYNEEKYLSDCLEHAIRNGKGLFEIVVVDNASSDKTAEVAARFPNVRVVHEARKGLTRARQRGLLEAKGDILAFIDADTRMPEGWVQKIEQAYAYDPKLVCISGPYIYYDAGPFVGFMVRLYWLFAVPVAKLQGFMAVGGNFAAKKSAIEQIGGFDTNIEFYGEDTNIARRLSAVGRVKFTLSLPMYTSARRFRGDGLLMTAWRYVKNYFSEAFLKRPTRDAYTDIR